MKFNFRKIVSVLTSTVMLSSTIALGAAANYPDPFVKGGNADVAVVYGSNAALTDVAAVVDITSNLASKLAEQTATGGTTSSVSTSGGDSVNLKTSSRGIYIADPANIGRTSISSSELPNVLADGKFKDITGTEYSYTQNIKPGVVNVTFDKSDGDLKDPALYLDVGTSATTPLYNYTLSLTNKNLNVSDSTNVQGQKIKILGVNYVVGASSTNTTLYLYGAGETVTIAGGETKTVKVGGVDHVISLDSTSSATAGKITVDGISQTVTESTKYTFSGSLVVYVKDITHPAYAGDVRSAELILGTNTLRLDHGSTVKVGANEDALSGTNVYLKAEGNGLISSMTVSVAKNRTKGDYVLVGDSFVDPVFNGLKVQFAAVTPGLNDSTRGNIKIETDNNAYAYATFTSAQAADKGQVKLTYVYDNNTASTAVRPLLAGGTVSSGKGVIHVLEGEDAKEGDYLVINQGDFGGIVKIDSFGSVGTSSLDVQLRDVLRDEAPSSLKFTLTNASGQAHLQKTGATILGGTGYTITANAAGTTLNITWSSAGTRTLFPRIKLKDGGWLAFLVESAVPNGTNVIFPDGQTTLATSGTQVSGNSSVIRSIHANGINWTIIGANATNSGAGSLAGINGSVGATEGDYVIVKNISGNGANCDFNYTQGPAVLFLEPKKWNDGSYGNYICTPLTTTGTLEISIADPVLNGTANSGQTSTPGTSQFVILDSNTDKKQIVDRYGSLVEKESKSNENGVARIQYPGSQMFFDLLIASQQTQVTGGSSTGSGTVAQLGSVAVSDNEVSSVSTKSLIVVGGSCVNTVAAKLLGSTSPVCGSAFEQSTSVGAGSFLIQSFTSPYAATKVATLVAGYNAGDTTNAAKYFITQPVNTAAGNKYKGTSATSATLTTTNSTA